MRLSVLLLLSALIIHSSVVLHSPEIPTLQHFYLSSPQSWVHLLDTIHVEAHFQVKENSKKCKVVWNTNGGEMIQQMGNNALIIPPKQAGKYTISASVWHRNKLISVTNIQFVVYKQLIILKADDLVSDPEFALPPRWKKFVDFVDSENIKASIGIIGSTLEETNLPYFESIKALHQNGNIEFWNHGYTHDVHRYNKNGHKWSEFYNRTLDEQRYSLQRTQWLGKTKLGIQFEAFGAPANAIDSNTVTALNQIAELNAWYFGNNNSDKVLISRGLCEIEYPTHVPNFQRFKQDYSNRIELLVLQIHPNSWDESGFKEFEKIIKELKSNQSIFITSAQWLRLKYPERTNQLRASNVDF